MKQPIITRDIERKAIYTDILYDPEWTYVEIFIDPNSEYGTRYSLSTTGCSCDYVVDWGDGCIEKNIRTHRYETGGTYTVRVKGSIYSNATFSETQKIKRGLFGRSTIKALQYGSKFETDMSLFWNSKDLEEIDPTFFANRPDLTDLSYMFSSCKKLKAIPEGLFDPLTNLSKIDHLFTECTEITTIPKGLFDKNAKLTNVDWAFASCIKLSSIESSLFDSATELISATHTFYDCQALETIPDRLFTNCSKLIHIDGMFQTSALTEIPPNLFRGCGNIETAERTFLNTMITLVPKGLFDDCTRISTFQMAFAYCKWLTEVPTDLFSKCKTVPNVTDVFYGDNRMHKFTVDETIENIGSYYKTQQ